jgi:hypothetical protein
MSSWLGPSVCLHVVCMSAIKPLPGLPNGQVTLLNVLCVIIDKRKVDYRVPLNLIHSQNKLFSALCQVQE